METSLLVCRQELRLRQTTRWWRCLTSSISWPIDYKGQCRRCAASATVGRNISQMCHTNFVRHSPLCARSLTYYKIPLLMRQRGRGSSLRPVGSLSVWTHSPPTFLNSRGLMRELLAQSSWLATCAQACVQRWSRRLRVHAVQVSQWTSACRHARCSFVTMLRLLGRLLPTLLPTRSSSPRGVAASSSRCNSSLLEPRRSPCAIRASGSCPMSCLASLIASIAARRAWRRRTERPEPQALAWA